MSLSTRTLGRIESLVAVAKMSASEHKMLLRIVEDAIAESHPRPSDLISPAGVLLIPGDWPAGYREIFWRKYPNKKAKAQAIKALDRVAKAGKTQWVDLISGLDRYILSDAVRKGFVKHPATWINGECWKDEEQTTPRPVEQRSSFERATDLLSGVYGAGSHQD